MGVLATGAMKTSLVGEVGKGNGPPLLPLGLTPDEVASSQQMKTINPFLSRALR